MKKFVTFEAGWADEFTVYGFRIFTDTEWSDYVRVLRTYTFPSFYFGTNEGWDDEDSEFYLDHMTITEITDEDAKKLIEIFDLKNHTFPMGLEWGTFPSFDPAEDEFAIDEL